MSRVFQIPFKNCGLSGINERSPERAPGQICLFLATLLHWWWAKFPLKKFEDAARIILCAGIFSSSFPQIKVTSLKSLLTFQSFNLESKLELDLTINFFSFEVAMTKKQILIQIRSLKC